MDSNSQKEHTMNFKDGWNNRVLIADDQISRFSVISCSVDTINYSPRPMHQTEWF